MLGAVAATVPFVGDEPELVVKKPLRSPGDDRGGDRVGRSPLPSVAEAERAVAEGVGQAFVFGRLQSWREHRYVWPFRRRVVDVDRVARAQRRWLQLSAPAQPPAHEPQRLGCRQPLET